MKTACCIDNQYIAIIFLCMFYCCFRNIRRFVLVTHGKYFHALLFSIDLQLFNRCRTIYITGCKKCFLAFCFQFSCDLCRSRCLTCTLKTNHHDYGKFLARAKCNLGCLRSHEIDHLFVYDLDDHLSRIQSAHNILTDCAFLYILDKFLNNAEVYIGFKQCHLDFLQCCLDIIFCQTTFAAQILEYVLQFFGKTVKCHPTTPLRSDLILLQYVP